MDINQVSIQDVAPLVAQGQCRQRRASKSIEPSAELAKLQEVVVGDSGWPVCQHERRDGVTHRDLPDIGAQFHSLPAETCDARWRDNLRLLGSSSRICHDRRASSDRTKQRERSAHIHGTAVLRVFAQPTY